MQFNEVSTAQSELVVANTHFVNKPYNCAEIATDDDGVIVAGTVIPSNDASAEGILFQDVVPAKNPNGAITIHGTIDLSKLPEELTDEAKAALTGLTFITGEVSE